MRVHDETERADQLQQAVVSALAAVQQEHAGRAVVMFWGQVDRELISFVREEGSRDHVVDTPDDVSDLMMEVREATTGADGSRWFSAWVRLSPDGSSSFDFNWDRRTHLSEQDPFRAGTGPYGQQPDDEAWIAEFRAHPRRPEATPDRAQGLVGTPVPDMSEVRTRLTGTAGAQPEALVRVHEHPAWVRVREAVVQRNSEALASSSDAELVDFLSEDVRRSERALDLFIDIAYRGLYDDFIDGHENRELIALLRAAPRVPQEALEFDLVELDPAGRIDPEGDGAAAAAFEVIDAIFGDLIRTDLVGRLGSLRSASR